MGSAERRVKCVEGEHRVPESQIRRASRFAGGDYRRAGRHYDSSICVDCLTELLSKPQQQGHRLTGAARWTRTSLEFAANG